MKEGTFYVTEAEDASAVLRDVTDGQVHTLADNPGVGHVERPLLHTRR